MWVFVGVSSSVRPSNQCLWPVSGSSCERFPAHLTASGNTATVDMVFLKLNCCPDGQV